jgi:membrane-associated protease RseP (regulator of RpoE activity)
MKKKNSRRLLLVAVGLFAAVFLVVISAAASVLAYRQFVADDNARLNLRLDGLQVKESQEFEGEGAVILRVEPGSPAEQAGLNRGALILSVNGRAVNSPAELKAAIGEYEAGDTVTLTVQDGEETSDVSVTLADAGPYLGVNVGPGGAFRFRAEGFGSPEGFALPGMPGRQFPGAPEGMPFEFHFDEFGFDHFDGEHGRFMEMFGMSAFVMSVQADSPAAAAGLEAGDAIIKLDGAAVESKDDLIAALAELSPGDDISLQVQRGDETLTIEVTLAPHPDDAERAYLGVFLAPGLVQRNLDLFEEQSNS